MEMDYSNRSYVLSSVENTQPHIVNYVKKPYPQFTKIILRSSDADSGNYLKAQFNSVSIGSELKGPAVMILDSFVMTDTNSGKSVPMEVHLTNIVQPRTFDSKSKSKTTLMAAFNGYTYQNQGSSSDSIGIPILDLNQFNNTQLCVELQSIDGSVLTNYSGAWTMSLLIVPYDNSVLN